jgi:hypothetical protein
MLTEFLPLNATQQITPRSLINYAQGLGWLLVPNGRRADIVVYHRPDSRLHQVIIPTDTNFVDYAETVAEAVCKLAEFEKRSANEVLGHLLLPPADLLRFREASPDAEAGNLPLDHAVRMVNGTRRLLLSVAHSALVPQAYHPRLSRSEAEEFVGRCRLSQMERGSFVLNVACPLEVQLTMPGGATEPFTRRVTQLLMGSLEALAKAADTTQADDLLDLTRSPGMSANLCESLLLLRPSGDRATLTVSATWSRALLPQSQETIRHVHLSQAIFEVAETIALRLRTTPVPRPARFLGFVDVLSGQPSGGDPRPCGEVEFTLFDDDEGPIRARGVLNTEDYAAAATAHLKSGYVAFKATLRRLPRISRIESVTDFRQIQFESEEASSS